MLSNIVKTIYTALETKDTLIRKHAHRVIDYSLSIADGLNLPPEEKEKLKTAALLHDIGKMRISDVILKKSTKLTSAEYDTIKRHPIEALNILEPIDEFQNVLIHIKYHHERWDGTGYPEGLQGETIPLLARILAVANSYDAMTTERVYQKKLSGRDALEELKRYSGKQFDPKIIEVFIGILEKENRRNRPDR
jgi:putative nucleotidyltransferase with HDIG domain